MHQISSSWTLFKRIFFPTFYLVFLGVGNLAFWFVNFENYLTTDLVLYRIIFFILFVGGIIYFYLNSWRLMRIDIDDEFVYVSNYFKTARYEFDLIDNIKEVKTMTRKNVVITLKAIGTFGMTIRFVPDKVRYEKYFRKNVHLTEKFN